MHNLQHRCSDVSAPPFAQSTYRSPSEELTTGFAEIDPAAAAVVDWIPAVVEAIDPHKMHRLVSYLGDDKSDTPLSYLPQG
jgi:hypothetical protein